MPRILLKPSFVRQFNTLPAELQKLAKECIALFADPRNHRKLQVHKLHGRLAEKWSFSVDYHYRIVFSYEGKHIAILLNIGDHRVYE